MASPHLPLPYIIIAAVALIASLAMVIPGDPEWWKVVVLGIVQGITEWLPISSTGHLLIVSKLLNYQGSIGGTFEIFIQVGTVVAVVAFYIQDLLKQAQALLGRSTSEEARAARTLWLGIVIAMVPAGIVGLLARDFIKAVLFETPQVIAGALIFGGIVFLVIELIPQRQTLTTELGQVSWKQALGVGIAQIFALIPGMSRSGSCIVGGLLAGLDRRTATAFSFYLAMPVLGGATLVDLISSLDDVQPDDWGRLLLGAVVSMIVGYLTIGWLLNYIARHNFVAFGIYRIIIGVLILGLVAVGVL
ncbi:undecaprenyl-diphosphatase [Candidatus Chloroploca asiatica]|uniref:Undecaprenyl-diphosphatase n=1 Tax=Candidatus Chloroploca asiatica TaxID=1506545 RepID=A0A2H3KHG8_9CHLR|nr:undecaprenyl-diphosphatase [Candidatus Chloroploca asiatica]